MGVGVGVGVGVGWRSTAPSRFKEPSAGSVILHELTFRFGLKRYKRTLYQPKLFSLFNILNKSLFRELASI